MLYTPHLRLVHPTLPLVVLANKSGAVKAQTPYTQTLLWHHQTAHQGEVVAMNWSPTFRHLATAGTDHWVRIWDAASGTLLSAHLFAGTQHVLAWSPDGSTLAVTGSGQLAPVLWEWQKDRLTPEPGT